MSHLWREHELPRWLKRILVIVNAFTALAIALYSTAVNWPVGDPTNPVGIRESVTLFVDQELSFWVIVSIVAVFGISGMIVKVADHRWNPQTKYITAALNALQLDLWAKPIANLSGSKHRHRITLFQAQRRCWLVRFLTRKPHSHRLVPRARLPLPLGRDPKRVWLCDHHVHKNCTGIAGTIYNTNQSLATRALPDLAKDGDKVVSKYAKLTNDSTDMVRKETIYSRIIGGIPLSSQSGGRWGVLVLDSCDPNAINPTKWEETFVQERVKLLSSILPEGKP